MREKKAKKASAGLSPSGIIGERILSPLWGLFFFTACTHGLRRGLYSCAAPRLRPSQFNKG
jgi:hypothetical protein